MLSRRSFISYCGATIGTPLLGYPVKSMLGGSETRLVQEDQQPYTAADYVQDGLFSMWDGIENSGWGIHDEAPKSFLDLVSQKNISFLGGTDREILDDGISLNPNRTSDNIARGRTSYTFSLQQDANKTVQVCASVNTENYESNNPMMFICGTNSGIGAQNGILFARRNGSTAWTSLGLEYVPEVPFVIAIESSSVGVSVFANGEKIGDNIGNLTYLSVSGWMQIGSYNGTLPACTTIHNVSLYTRALSDAEIKYNYKVHRARFNLP